MTDLYRFYNSTGELLYVGISLSAITRATQHKKQKSWWHEVARMDVSPIADHFDPRIVERQTIIAERPRFNIQHNRVIPGGQDVVQLLMAQRDEQGFSPKVTNRKALKQAAAVLANKTTAEAYTIPEFASAFGVCRATVYNMINRGDLQAIKIGWSRRILKSEANRFIEWASA